MLPEKEMQGQARPTAYYSEQLEVLGQIADDLGTELGQLGKSLLPVLSGELPMSPSAEKTEPVHRGPKCPLDEQINGLVNLFVERMRELRRIQARLQL